MKAPKQRKAAEESPVLLLRDEQLTIAAVGVAHDLELWLLSVKSHKEMVDVRHSLLRPRVESNTRYKGNSSQQMAVYSRRPVSETILFWRKCA